MSHRTEIRTAGIMVFMVALLVIAGLIMLYSTSGVRADRYMGDPGFYCKRQALWLALGVIASIIAARVDYRFWRKNAWLLASVATGLLLLALLPGIGVNVNGSSRWIRIGPFFRFQPSELAKFAIVVLLSWWMTRVQRRANELKFGLVMPLMLLGVMLVLILAEPDFGTTILLALVGMVIMFIGGARLEYLVVSGLLGAFGLALMIAQSAEHMRRVLVFLWPERYFKTDAYQLMHALFAFVSGGARGVGFGDSIQKQFYLPEAHTDFIFAIIGEEMGLFVALGVIALFMAVMLCGVRISVRAPDKFGKLLGFGITTVITLQACVNMGVVTGCLPTKGIPLPFISFGGSSMLVTLMMIGVLVNIARQIKPQADFEMDFTRDTTHTLD